MFRAYNIKIARPELDQLKSSVDMAFNMLQRDIYQIRAELRDMGQEIRQEQQEQSRLCAVVGGWPDNTPPEDRAHFIYEQ